MIYQVLPTLSYGDAVSNHAIALAKLMRFQGFPNRICAENIHPKLSLFCQLVSKIKEQIHSSDVVIYHMSTGSDLNRWFRDLKCRKILIYHNITPPEFFEPYSESLANLTRRGREDLAELAAVTDISIADSEYNAQELVELGFQNVSVVPILLPFSDLLTPPDPVVLDQMSDGKMNLLFVGRISPNKAQEDVIRVFSEYHKKHCPASRLILAGSEIGMESYYSELRTLTDQLDIREDVVFTSHISFPQLLAYYRTADAFICMSYHEGFCVPLVESMFFGIPIFARKTTAIPGTLGRSGVQFDEADYEQIAVEIHGVMTDPVKRGTILQMQRDQLQNFDNTRIEELFIGKITNFLA
jgi:glycosyltransferase involved in cell wall biosynthesis